MMYLVHFGHKPIVALAANTRFEFPAGKPVRVDSDVAAKSLLARYASFGLVEAQMKETEAGVAVDAAAAKEKSLAAIGGAAQEAAQRYVDEQRARLAHGKAALPPPEHVQNAFKAIGRRPEDFGVFPVRVEAASAGASPAELEELRETVARQAEAIKSLAGSVAWLKGKGKAKEEEKQG